MGGRWALTAVNRVVTSEPGLQRHVEAGQGGQETGGSQRWHIEDVTGSAAGRQEEGRQVSKGERVGSMDVGVRLEAQRV